MDKKFLAFLVLSIFLITTAGCSHKIQPGTAQIIRPEINNVQITAIQKTAQQEFYETSGTVKAKSVSHIASKVMGTVAAIYVKEGDPVAAGQVLAALEDRDLASRAAASQAGYQEALQAAAVASQNQALAATTYQRYFKLYNDKAISQQEMDQQATQKRIADLEAERAKASMNRYAAESQVYQGLMELTAPTAGIVTAKSIDVGSTASPGTVVFTVEDTSSYTLEADIDESLSGQLSVGTQVRVVLGASEKLLTGTMAEISPAIDASARKFHVKVNIQAEGLRSGLYAKLLVPMRTKDMLLVPSTAIVTKGQLTGVYAVDAAGVVTYRLIRLGKVYDTKTEILSGITDGTKILVAGLENAVDGGRVSGVNTQ